MKNVRRVKQYLDGRLVGTYLTIQSASKKSNVSMNLIRKSIESGESSKKNPYIWTSERELVLDHKFFRYHEVIKNKIGNGFTDEELERLIIRLPETFNYDQIMVFYKVGDKKFIVTENAEIISTIGIHATSLRSGKYKYSLFSFKSNNIIHNTTVHRFTYQAFNPDKDITGLDIHHIDNNKFNNHISNLEAITRAENIKHRDADGGSVAVPIIRTDLNGSNRVKFKSIKEASDYLNEELGTKNMNYSPSISVSMKSPNRTAYGYKFYKK